MNKLFKLFWIISLVLYLGFLLLIYAFLPDRVGIHANTHGMPDEFVAREYFFYFSLAAFILSNALLYALYKLMYVTSRTLASPRASVLRQSVGSWLLGFAGVLNLFYILAMGFFAMLNSREKFDMEEFMLVVYTGPFLMALMFGLLAYILIKRRSTTS